MVPLINPGTTPSPGVGVVARLSLFHGFDLYVHDLHVAVPGNVQRLIAFLAVQGRRLHRSIVASALWMDVTDQRAAANLRSALWRVRRISEALVRADGSFLRLGEDVWVDHSAAIDRIRRIIEGDGSVVASQVSVEALSDDLLPEWYEDWVVLERERLRQLRLHGLEALCARLSDGGWHAAAVEAGLAAVATEPLRESAQRVLIRAYLAEGNMAEAVRQYDAFAAALIESLGIAPSSHLRTLVSPCR
jgi:DNA-binding SARP family transcriptional activator